MSEAGVQMTRDGRLLLNPGWAEEVAIVHGMTTRTALPSPGKADLFESMRTLRAAGLVPDWPCIGAQQIHGVGMYWIGREFTETLHALPARVDPTGTLAELHGTDALLTDHSELLLVIQTADCLPVFVMDRNRSRVGLAHCGWRGLMAGLAGKLAEAMAAHGGAASDFEAWLAPCIQPTHYEVSPSLVEKFQATFPAARVVRNETYLDLPSIARHQLEQAGLAPGNIVSAAECTLGRPDRYHSYRGQGEAAGRMLSFIGMAGTSRNAGFNSKKLK